ncbi:hypothetical protein, conserved [Babesia bigemina]|uniref:C3H1-type domain-containing protein n=1 Tax=Babesia bigemina TaxID=5866 RepID=A0A061DEL8_BABBI|nr:hypothetical protein, conserved [Babesia bigemina]CDR97505.1 hypothetical protein, conserved [Babesia bigemina]|eukprot:XP_012769691.1 hypothetical protein, conserved [Babesia bigemina]
MGFLSGVLEGVKNTQTYNVGKNTLNSVSSVINKHLCSGHDGFTKLLPRLTREVEKYNKEVRESNKAVSEPINELIKYVKDRGELLGSINKYQVTDNIEQDVLDAAEKTMAEKLKECQKKAETFNSVFNLSTQTDMKNAISYLNSTLSERVRVALRAVSHETERLKTMSGKERKDLDGLQAKIQSALSALGNCVNDKIQKDIENLVKQLKEGVNTILKHLKDIDGRLRQYVQKLEEWMESAKKEIDRIRNEDVKKILDETTDGVTGTKYLIEKDAEKLIRWKESLSDEIQRVKKKLVELVQQALKEVATMNRAVQMDLYLVSVAINDEIRKYVSQYVKKIQAQILQITDQRNGLQGVETKIVKEYAERFKEGSQGFQAIVKEWIDGIFKNNGLVKQSLAEYIRMSKKGGYTLKQEYVDVNAATLTQDKSLRIATAIKDALDISIENAQIDGDKKNNVEGNIGAVHDCIIQFVVQLNDKITQGKQDSGDTNKLVSSLVDAFERTVSQNGDTHSTARSYLIPAMAAVLSALYSKANQAAEELQSFTGDGEGGDNIGKNLDTALDVALKLNAGLTTALTESGQHGYNTAKPYPGLGPIELDANIAMTINRELEELLPQAKGSDGREDAKIDLEKVRNFINYPTYVKQPKTSTENPSEGQLPESIGAIKEEAAGIYITHITDGLTTLSSDLTKHLGVIMDAITTTTDRVKSKLDDFKNKKIGNAAHSKPAQKDTLQELHCKFLELHKYFEKNALKTAEAFAAYADRSGKNIIDPLKQHVNNEVKKAQDSIIAEAKKNYISSIQSLLQRFASKVHSELETLPKSIEDDLTLGFKGFMVKFEQHFVDTVKHIQNISSKSAVQTTEKGRKIYPFSQAVLKLRTAFSSLMSHLESQEDFTSDFERVKMANSVLVNLLNKLATSQHYDHTFSNDLDELKKVIEGFKPSTYGEAKCPLLLNTLKNGFTTLVSELDKAYISAYDSETFSDDLVKEDNTLTKYGKYYAKVFLTALRTLDVSLYGLKHECKSLTGQKINSSTDLGRLFVRLGFKVAEENREHWELQNRTVISGQYVANRLTWRVSGANDNQHLKICESKKRDDDYLNVFDILRCLVTHAKQYFEVCHQALRPKSRLPCNVNEMLVWFTGLPHHPVYEELIQNGLSAPFENPSKQRVVDDDGLELTLTDTRVESMTAHPSNITYNSVNTALQHLCTKSRDLLTTVMGHGNAETVYAVDFHTNTFNLKYPTSGEECLQTILDILRRMLPPLRYLYYQCSLGTNHGGWAQCLYGRDIKTSKWPCKNHSTEQPKCHPTDEVTCQPNCQPTSPLMSYLGDCLIGHLPHKLTSIGCRSVCSTCPSVAKLGMPCVTPLGFRAFSGSTKTGRDIYEILRLLFGSGLVSSLLCLAPIPPSTLPEHFQFALALTHVLHNTKNATAQAVTTAFNTSTNEVSIDLYKEPTKLTGALSAAYGNSQSSHNASNHIPKSADMSSLAMSQSCMLAIEDNVHCGPYLQTLFCDTYYYIAAKHTNVYLSWAVYLPWTLYGYLKSLFDSYCSISCQDWGCSRCVDGISCRPGKHGDGYSCRCRSLVGCRGVLSTLYGYGFTFGDAKKLLSDDQRRYCRNLYSQLQNVLKSQHFTKLFAECDNFIWTIRQPFTYLVLALWSLSLFYLICVMVGRLDVLHIRSHLRSPSSHRITAQSLLAAAQVGRLAKISYLQP